MSPRDTDAPPLTEDELDRFNQIVGRLNHLASLLERLRATAERAPTEAARELMAQVISWPQSQWNELARAVVSSKKSAWKVCQSQLQPGTEMRRASVSTAFALALGLLHDLETEDPDRLDPAVFRYLVDLLGISCLNVDVHRSAREQWAPECGRMVHEELARAFADPNPETNLYARGPVAGGVGCASRLFGVTPRTIWNNRAEAGSPADDREELHRQIRFRGDVLHGPIIDMQETPRIGPAETNGDPTSGSESGEPC